MIMPQETPIVESVPILDDNYVWMFATGENSYAAVDPGESKAVVAWLKAREKTLSHILLTHHHGDHIGGAAELRKIYGAQLIGCRTDAHRLPPLDQPVQDGQTIAINGLTVEVRETPGHTIGHVIYQIGDGLFVGDTLFSLGCGRLFEGSAEMMWQSLQKIMVLPDRTQLYCAHEYTLTNLGFALTLEPEKEELLTLKKSLIQQSNQNQLSVPTTLAHEKRLNPFLRIEDPSLINHLGLTDLSPSQRFATIRSRRNNY